MMRLTGQQKRHGLRHGQISLAGSGWSDANDVVLLDRVEIAALVDGLGRHAALAGSGRLPFRKWSESTASSCATRSAAVLTSEVDGCSRRASATPAARRCVDARDVRRIALDRQLVPLRSDSHAELVFQMFRFSS
jgi:hypothetical protein